MTLLSAATTFAMTMLTQATPSVSSPAPPSPDVKIDSVWDFVVKGGPVMIPIAACSLVALAVIVERWMSLRRKNIIPPTFFPGLKAVLLESGGDKNKALSYCGKDSGPLAEILSAGLRKLGEPASVIRTHIEEAGQREVFKLRKYLRSLSVIASVAPLLGLLGTIFGMIEAFQTVASSGEALGRTELLAKGIYEAMITTAAGLIVAIPTVIAYHAIWSHIDKLVFEMDTLTLDFLETVSGTAGGKSASPGHGDNGQPQPVSRVPVNTEKDMEIVLAAS